MLKNYITIAFRNFGRNISYTIINVVGLALGITCALVLFLLISYLTSFDKHHVNGERIYRIVSSRDHESGQDLTPGVPPPLPEAIRTDFTGIESVLFISGRWKGLIRIEEDGIKRIFEEQNKIAYTDSTYFDFFERKLIDGDRSLTSAGEAVISERLAKKYFGDDYPIGKIIHLDNSREFTIKGIIDDPSENTSFPFDLFLSFETIRKEKLQEGWRSVHSDDQCYVMLEPGKTAEDINSQMPAFILKYNGEDDAKELKRWLQPLDEIRYDTRFSNYAQKSVGKESIWAMGVLALFLIITGCINFINLTTAVAVKRSKEVGIRKVMGSQRTQLILQYLSETSLITLFALLISTGLAELVLIRLNSFLDLDLHINLSSIRLWIFIFSVWSVVSLASGLYPAFLISGFSPIQALKHAITNRASGGFVLRRSLVVFQFIISQFLIIGTIILLTQIKFLESKDLGFSKEAIITVPIPENDSLYKKILLRDQITQLKGVQLATLCSTPPSSGSVSVTDFQLDGLEGNYLAQIKIADHRYMDLFELKLVTGRIFDETDSMKAWIVNERLLKVLKMEPDEIIGRNLRMWEMEMPVIGVVKDFHTVSLSREIEPTILFKNYDGYRNLSIKVEPGQFNSTIKSIEKLWTAQYPDFLFNYEFLDEQVARFYTGINKMSVLLLIFSCIAIAIGCLGLYGLISFMATQKEREIGIRKVLGATTPQIMFIFSREFILLIFIAFLIAAPLSGYVMKLWLQNFAYRIPLAWTMFATGIIATLIIAFITVSYRSLRAAIANPVDALRSE